MWGRRSDQRLDGKEIWQAAKTEMMWFLAVRIELRREGTVVIGGDILVGDEGGER